MRSESEPFRRPQGWAIITLACITGFGLLAGCDSDSGTSSHPRTSSPEPLVTPTTAQEVRDLTKEIPLEGNAMVPLRWRLLTLKDPALEAPLLAARQYITLRRILHTDEYPSRWIPHLLAVGEEPSERHVENIQKESPLPWEERLIGPSWIWIMTAKTEGTGRASITYCTDDGWQGKPAVPPTSRMRTGGVETVEVSLLKDFPGGPVWKVTKLWPSDRLTINKPYVKQCTAWWKTHTSTEGWTVPT
ncbi:MAG: hypothetical protein QG608_3137 [Actinomycetota bacterium]|nr:hypothetical protein [Actinomycetota bacterium]